VGQTQGRRAGAGVGQDRRRCFDPRHDTISHNIITGNLPLDVFFDGSGSDDHFPGNACNTSQPCWICN
jgi:hypothetical protein